MRFIYRLLFYVLLLAVLYPAGRVIAQIVLDDLPGPLKITPEDAIPLDIMPVPLQWVTVNGSAGELANPDGWGDSYLQGDRVLWTARFTCITATRPEWEMPTCW